MKRILLYKQIICHFKNDQQDKSRLSIRLVMIILINISDALVIAINDLLFLVSSLVAILFASSFMTPLMDCTKKTLVTEGDLFLFFVKQTMFFND